MDTTQRDEIRAWLGDDWTPEQLETIIDAYQQWEADADLPDSHGPDAEDERRQTTEAMLTAIAQHVDGTADLAQLSDEHLRATVRAEQTRVALRAATIVAIRLDGLSEYQAAERAGVSRMTIRSWLGK